MPVSLLEYFRVRDWVHTLGIPILGVVYSLGTNALSSSLVLAILTGAFGISFAYSFDSVFEEFGISRRLLPSIAALFLAFACSLIAGTVSFALTLACALLIFAYDIPPLRLKSMPVAVTAANAIGFSLLFLIGTSTAGGITTQGIMIALLIALISIPVQMVHETEHYKKDRSKKIITTAVKFGTRFTKHAIRLSIVIALLYSLTLLISGFSYALFVASALYLGAFLALTIPETKNMRMYVRCISIIFGIMLLIIFISGL